ncbi:serine/threonine-protein kinase [Azotobacter beijerinckii]|uniref:Serine/threonine protein kinase n=1 Tax=Azotobacter beijerinckii TaxID=170623 RepID=A0A1I4CS29_9GAMM|nr:serine/threonine-protein kinase [Azotobacter beijerinckii]SFB24861.1 Serine/threonine protein kinase [Azotobacter beijerinckii]SFK83440.1 Serine/threonine protein kinase [Azotobacter beijerinckii]
MNDSVLDIPGYRLHGLLGKGGMAAVYLATQHSLQRQVAIKVLGKAEDQSFTLRFIREGHLLASLHHPAIITIYDIDRLPDGRHYLAMEYLPGGDLARHKGELFAPERALEIVRQIAGGLAVVHAKGLVHRDVKPANILFRGDGSAVLTDFGVAKDLDLDSELTQFGIAVGSPAYSSPEQAQCQPLDARSDIYSLGVILLEMLIGTNPFRGSNYTQTVMNHMQLPLPSLSGALGPFRGVLERMLAKEPGQRFADCRELLAALDEIELGDPDETRLGPGLQPGASRAAEASPAEPAPRGARRARWPAVLGVLLLGGALAGGGFYWHQQRQVDEFLAKAERRLAAGQLQEPAQDNAEHYFREALRLDARSLAARVGLERVGRAARIAGLQALGEQRLAEGRLQEPAQDSAEHYFRQVLELEAGHAGALDGLRRLIEARIAGYLARAEQSIVDKRLLLPEDDSAVYYYRQVLGWMPSNAQALAGLHRIATQYRDLANATYRRKDFPGALEMIERGLQAEPENPELLRMREEHRELLASARAARAAQTRRPVQRAPAPPSEAPSEDGNPIKQAWNNLFGN